MNAARILLLIGAILTLLSTFLFAFIYLGGDAYASGIGFIQSIEDIFENPSSYETVMDVPFYIVLILFFVFFIFILSGLFQIGGLWSRGLAFFGSILPIAFSIFIMLFVYEIIDIDYGRFTIMFWEDAFVEDILPFHISVGENAGLELSLGTYLLLGGGALGFVGAILGPKD
jgi:hypothetical protein